MLKGGKIQMRVPEWQLPAQVDQEMEKELSGWSVVARMVSRGFFFLPAQLGDLGYYWLPGDMDVLGAQRGSALSGR